LVLKIKGQQVKKYPLLDWFSVFDLDPWMAASKN
jgi:hypothetical protein